MDFVLFSFLFSLVGDIRYEIVRRDFELRYKDSFDYGHLYPVDAN